MDDKITAVVFGALEIICGIIMLVAAVKIVARLKRSRQLVHVKGQIVAHQKHVASMRSASGYGTSRAEVFRPVVRFDAPDGQSHDLQHPVATSRPPAVGTQVDVAFDPRHPEKAEVASRLARYLAPGVTFIAVGILLVILLAVEHSVRG